MRSFHETIFMGSGQNTLRNIRRLKRRLHESFSILSGMQQPPDPCQPYDRKLERSLNQEAKRDLEDIVRDVATALGCSRLLKGRRRKL
jgi:hypothetical protein